MAAPVSSRVSFLALGSTTIFDPAAPDPAWAVVRRSNPLRETTTLRSPRVVAWSGWLDEQADPRHGRFPLDFRVWTVPAWDALSRACDALLPRLAETPATLLLRPHARQVLSDAQACITFLRPRPDQPIRLLLDPASMLTDAMLPTAEDHLARIFEALGPHPNVAAVLLANLRRAQDGDLVPAPLHSGLLDPRLLIDPWRAHCPANLPCILPEPDFATQISFLSSAP